MTAVLSQEIKDNMIGHILLKRFGKAEDVAAAVRFLASEEAGYITGQVMHVNGGMYMCRGRLQADRASRRESLCRSDANARPFSRSQIRARC